MNTKLKLLRSKAKKRASIFFTATILLFAAQECYFLAHQSKALHIVDFSSGTRNATDWSTRPISSNQNYVPPFSNRLIIAGAQKGGTTALWMYLNKHPDIQGSGRGRGKGADPDVRNTELHFFDKKISKHVERFPNGTIYPEHRRKVLIAYKRQWRTRRASLASAKSFSNSTMRVLPSSSSSSSSGKNKIMMEKTPSYIMTPKVPYTIKSIVPDAKIIFSLRDPVRRAYSHYQMLTRKGSFPDLPSIAQYRFVSDRNLSFEECVTLDIEALQKSGVVAVDVAGSAMNHLDEDTNNEVEENVKVEKDAGSDGWQQVPVLDLENLDEAWARYTKLSIRQTCDNIIGRGLYVMQLRIWWKVYNQKERRDKFLIVKSESLLPTETMDGNGDGDGDRVDLKRITDFLGVVALNVTSYDTAAVTVSANFHLASEKESTISGTTEITLRDLFGPFNYELGEMLGGGEIWSNPWRV